MKDLRLLVRPNIWRLEPYSSARDEYSGHEAHVFLDANECPYNAPYNRYPDPLQREVKQLVSDVKGIAPEHIFLGNGSDEAIDLIFRVFCVPGRDNVVAIDPTYGMYSVCAAINDVEYRKVPLDDEFQTTSTQLLSACNDKTKLIWICSPNNPTGNNINRNEIIKTITNFDGIVIVDEAYSDFSKERPLRLDLDKFPNLVVLNTFSNAWGCAAIRLGMAFASKEIVSILNKVKHPYNINSLTQQQALDMLKEPYEVDKWVKIILLERNRMIDAISMLNFCKKIYNTDSNFILVKMDNAQKVYDYLKDNGVIVRNRTQVSQCNDCLRITIGSKSENNELLSALRQY